MISDVTIIWSYVFLGKKNEHSSVSLQMPKAWKRIYKNLGQTQKEETNINNIPTYSRTQSQQSLSQLFLLQQNDNNKSDLKYHSLMV